MSFQKVVIVGNLGSDPELKYTQNGNAVCNLSVATNEKWTDKQGQSQERTTWFRVTVWGKQAENCEKYLSKGRQVLVEGKIKTDSYEKDGVTHYTWEVNAHSVQFLSGGTGAPSGGGGQRRDQPVDDYQQEFNDDDIPFVVAWVALPFLQLVEQYWGVFL